MFGELVIKIAESPVSWATLMVVLLGAIFGYVGWLIACLIMPILNLAGSPVIGLLVGFAIGAMAGLYILFSAKRRAY